MLLWYYNFNVIRWLQHLGSIFVKFNLFVYKELSGSKYATLIFDIVANMLLWSVAAYRYLWW